MAAAHPGSAFHPLHTSLSANLYHWYLERVETIGTYTSGSAFHPLLWLLHSLVAVVHIPPCCVRMKLLAKEDVSSFPVNHSLVAIGCVHVACSSPPMCGCCTTWWLLHNLVAAAQPGGCCVHPSLSANLYHLHELLPRAWVSAPVTSSDTGSFGKGVALHGTYIQRSRFLCWRTEGRSGILIVN